MGFDANISSAELAESYFPAFRAAVVASAIAPTGVMCSYNALNGVPTCASQFLDGVLRGEWGFQGYAELWICHDHVTAR